MAKISKTDPIPLPEFADIVRYSREAIIIWKIDETVSVVSPSAATLLGFETEEIEGQPVSRIMPQIHEGPAPSVFDRLRKGETIESIESHWLGKAGVKTDILISHCPIRDKSGEIVAVMSLGSEVTTRNLLLAAERDQVFLASIVWSADDAIVTKSLEGIVTSWNPGAERIFGYSSQEMIGKPIALLIPPNQPNEEPLILEQIRNGNRIDHYQTKRVRKDGRIIDVSITVSPVRNSAGRIIGASKIAREITDSKRAEAREREILREAQDARMQADLARRQAEEANSAKDEFLAIVSHELRTPITAILGWTRMLASGLVPPDHQKEAFKIIDRNARSQAQLIEDLLDVSRIISGKLRIEFKSVDLPAVINQATETLRPALEAKGVQIETDLSTDTGLIAGDSERLQQVTWNLLSNAIKFTPGGGTVRIQLRRVDSNVEIRVSDTGSGIEPEFLPHIFQRFSQADSSITRNRTGLGVGLAIVRSLVELHGGTVSVSSEGKGKGATFTVTLPVYGGRAISNLPSAGSTSFNRSAFSGVTELTGLKILVVDDEPDTCNLLRYIFVECGAIVETALSAEEALGTIERWDPDILISDISMPNMDGFELIRILRRERKNPIPAVALTAMARVEDRLKALAAGFQLHVAKPVEPSELIAVASTLVGLVDRRQRL